LHISDDRWPFDRDIARVGFPVGSMHYFSTGRVRENTERIYDLLKRLSDSPRVQALLALSLAFALLRSDRLAAPESMSPDVVTSLLLNDRRTGLPMELALLFAQWSILDERWLNALDKIGTLKTFFYGLREREQAGVGALVHLFAKHSDRVGILPLIVAAFRMPSTPFELSGIPQVFFERYEDPKIRWAAVILELARGGVRREGAGTLATITAKLESDGVAELAEVLAALARYERFDEATDHYLLELQRHLSRAEWLQRGKLVAALNGSLCRRSSGVTEPGVWRSLALPNRLLDLVATSGVGAHPRSEAAP
ncbi:MAG: hypothetical protein LC647_00710, partial [Beggiatoa sp.]|nr:hypothetical protein [Beggiatoa sp.]